MVLTTRRWLTTADARDMRGGGENRLDLARIAAVVRHRAGPVEREVARRLRPKLRRIRRERRARVGDRGEAPRSRPRPVRRRPAPARLLSATTSATGWPTCITRSRASAGRNGTISFAPLRPTSGGCTEVEPTPAASRSVWVSTATTPGAAARGFDVDRRDARMRMRRAHEHARGPGSCCGASSTKRPSPRTSASSSTRGSKW